MANQLTKQSSGGMLTAQQSLPPSTWLAREMDEMLANTPNQTIDPITAKVWSEKWQAMLSRYGKEVFAEAITEAQAVTPGFPPTPEHILQACERSMPLRGQAYKPYEAFEKPKDPVDEATLAKFNAKVKEISEGKKMA